MKKVYFLIFLIIFSSSIAMGRLIELSDTQMDKVIAQSGVAIGISNYKMYRNFEYIGYRDTDTGGEIYLNHVEIMETLETGNVDTNLDNLRTGIYIDVFLNPDSIPMVSYIADDFNHRFDLHVQSINFCGHEIGNLDIGKIYPYSERYYATAHSQGIDFQYNLSLQISNFDYTYQYNPENSPDFKSFHMGNIYLAKTFSQNPADDPSDPTTWQPQGTFQFGDLNPYGDSSYNPASLDIGVDTDTNLAIISINLPMQGSFRVDDLQVGGKDFGPIAIDDIVVHHMKIKFIP